MDTLYRHVMVLHGDSEQCSWGACATRDPPVELLTDEAFVTHVKRAHLVPYQWHMGDGCQNTIPEPKQDPEPLPAYLFDKNGKQVTPSIIGQEIEDPAVEKQKRLRLRRLVREMEENSPWWQPADVSDAEGRDSGSGRERSHG